MIWTAVGVSCVLACWRVKGGSETYAVVLWTCSDAESVRYEEEHEDGNGRPDVDPDIPEEAREDDVNRPQHKDRYAAQDRVREILAVAVLDEVLNGCTPELGIGLRNAGVLACRGDHIHGKLPVADVASELGVRVVRLLCCAGAECEDHGLRGG